jgi:hypothetical protein
MSSIFSHDCSNCHRETQPRYSDINDKRALFWYVCGVCRHSWRCTGTPNAGHLVVTAESPYTQKDQSRDITALTEVKSPCCGSGWRVRETFQDKRGHWRRHLCRNDSKSFYTCVDAQGSVSVFVRKPAKHQIEIA